MKDRPRLTSYSIFKFCVLVTALICAFLYGVIAHRNNLPPVPQIKEVRNILRNPGELLNSGLSLHLQPSRGQGDGVTINRTQDDETLILLAGFFDNENQARLIRRDGSVFRKWSLDYFMHFPDPDARSCNPRTPLTVDTHGATVTRDGEIVFNYEYCGTVKLDQCGAVIWALNDKTHHSLVKAEAGGFWLLGREEWQASASPTRFPPFSSPGAKEAIEEDTLLRIDENGVVLEEVSIPTLMREGGLEALLTANGANFYPNQMVRTELIHANKVAELPSAIADAYPLFDTGDLAISMRQLNLVMVIDPTTKAIKWHQTGPWLRQHDPEFRRDGRISIFNNNVYRTAYPGDQTDLSVPFTTNIVAVNPVTRETEVIFGDRPGQEMLSVIRGQHELLDDNRMLITEFDAGRVLEVNAAGEIIWEYVNRHDDKYVGEITNAAAYPMAYFQSTWKTCAN